MILSDGGIQSRLDKKELIIDPLDQDCIQPASVDLKLGREFIIVKHWGADILDFNSQPSYHSVSSDDFLVPSHSFVLATTVETLHLPDNLTAFVEGRSSVGRMGLFIQNAGWVDPGFKGQLTLELYNANNLPIRLRSGRRICQIVFCEMDQKTKTPYKGKYQGQKGATGTRIFMDKEIVQNENKFCYYSTQYMNTVTTFFPPNSTLGVIADQDEPDSGISFYFAHRHHSHLEYFSPFQRINKSLLLSK